MFKVEITLKDHEDILVAKRSSIVSPESFENAEEDLGKLQYYLLRMTGKKPIEVFKEQIHGR